MVSKYSDFLRQSVKQTPVWWWIVSVLIAGGSLLVTLLGATPNAIRHYWYWWAMLILVLLFFGVTYGAFNVFQHMETALNTQIGELRRENEERWKRNASEVQELRKEQNIKIFALEIDQELLADSRGKGAGGFALKDIVQRFGRTEDETKEALQLLKRNGKLNSDASATVWSVPLARRLLD